MRLIPGKTKVNIELFRGITVWDVVVGGIALIMLVFVLISNLPGKLWVCLVIAALAAFLVIRLDEQPNYVYLLHVLSFFGYNRAFRKTYSDETLIDMGENGVKDESFKQLYVDEPEVKRNGKKKLTKEEKKALRLAGKEKTTAVTEVADAPDEQPQSLSKREKKRLEKEKERQRKEEDKLLKSKDYPEEEKQKIRDRRAEESREAAVRMAAAKDATAKRLPMENIIPFTGINDGYIEYLDKKYYGAVLEIDPVEFRFFSRARRDNSIENCFGRIIRSLHAGYSANIVKLERPIMYDRYLVREYDKLDLLGKSYENGMLSEEELKARVEIQYDRINELLELCDERKVFTSFYYLVLFESDKRQLDMQVRDAEQQLRQGELTVRRLDDTELALFLKYTNQIDFDEHDVDKVRHEDLVRWAQPETVDIKVRHVEINHIITHNFCVVNYPTVVGDAWLAGVMSMPATKVVFKFRPMDRAKAIRNIDHSLTELRGQWSSTGIDSRRMEIETHIDTLQELLTTLQNDSESLLECNIYISAYDIVATRNSTRMVQPPPSELPTLNEFKKQVRRAWQEASFRLNNMEFDQVQAFIGSQVSALDPLIKEGRGIPSNTIAASFPWIFAHVSDEGGVKLGESDGMPVFIDFFRRDSERVNSNMVIVGKSGSGKSYATKSLLANLAAEDAKIFILDPENEYTELAGNLHGQIINVGNAQYGRLNPFQIITALDDDEEGEGTATGSYATHLQFLEEFFKQIMPDCEKDAMEYLNTLVDHMYLEHDITAETDLSRLRPEDYPIFDDLYDEVLQEFQSSDNPFTRDLLRSLMNYISKFSTGGRNANIWNGPSTITTEENFTVFNFQSMLANRNQTIANAQMLLVLKYLDNEIIKNRDYNTKYRANRKIVIVIDEAHVFIDSKFPIALDFMFQLAKRIRKYNGMQIVITQNIKDFVGSEELERKSTAIINACQYSFIFALAPNDMQDLVKLYEKAGGINESEQEEIVQAPRGRAFVIMGPTSRSSFTVETAEGITEMFEERDYQSRYFSGADGEQNWEDFIGTRRPARALIEAPEEEPYSEVGDGDEHEKPSYSGKGVVLNVFEEDEYEEYEKQKEETPDSVTFSVGEEADKGETVSEKPEPAKAKEPEWVSAFSHDKSGANDQSIAVFSMIANALGRMADAAENRTVPVPAAVTVSAAESTVPAAQSTVSEISDEVSDLLREKEEEIRRLKEENEKIRSEALEETDDEDELTGYDTTEDDDAEDDTEDIFDFGGDDEYGEEKDGDLAILFGVDEDEEDEEEGFFDDDGSEYDEDYDDESDIDEDESEDEDDEYDEDDEDNDEDEDEDDEYDEDEDEDDEDEDEDDDDDFMSSFCAFADKIRNMGVFEKMKLNGNTVSEISFEDLAKEAKLQLERKRSKV